MAYSLPLPTGPQEAVYEDVPVGTVILTVTATDADSGNFALIEYSLGDGEGKFAINPSTVSRQWRARVWRVGSGMGPGSQAEQSQQNIAVIPMSGSCHLELGNLRGFLATSPSPVSESQTFCRLRPFCPSRCGKKWPESFGTSSLWDKNL